jgi:hypothetical protein
MATLNVFVTRAGNACKYSDESWKITVWDCDLTLITKDKQAVNAHAPFILPPGRYIVRGTNAKGKKTQYAIAQLCCGESCVFLFVESELKPGGEPRPCHIEITSVVGIGTPAPTSVKVQGSAEQCDEVVVTVFGPTGKQAQVKTDVGHGEWTATLPAKGLGARCGEAIAVMARCSTDRRCFDQREISKLECRRPDRGQEDTPK